MVSLVIAACLLGAGISHKSYPVSLLNLFTGRKLAVARPLVDEFSARSTGSTGGFACLSTCPNWTCPAPPALPPYSPAGTPPGTRYPLAASECRPAGFADLAHIHIRNGRPHAQLAATFGIGTTTAHRCVTEAVGLAGPPAPTVPAARAAPEGVHPAGQHAIADRPGHPQPKAGVAPVGYCRRRRPVTLVVLPVRCVEELGCDGDGLRRSKAGCGVVSVDGGPGPRRHGGRVAGNRRVDRPYGRSEKVTGPAGSFRSGAGGLMGGIPA